MKNKKNPNHFPSFRCDFNTENPNDKIMIEKILHLRHITQFNNKQLLNFLLCLGDETLINCKTFSDFLGMFSIGKKTHISNVHEADTQLPAVQMPDMQIIEYQTSDAQTQKPIESPEPANHATEQVATASTASSSDTTLDDLFQSDDDPETEKMIADMLNL